MTDKLPTPAHGRDRRSGWLISIAKGMTPTLIGTLIGISIGITITVGALSLNVTMKLIERLNIGPMSGMVVNVQQGGCASINYGPGSPVTVCGEKIEQPAVSRFIETARAIVQNGGFENGFAGWGSGFYERLFSQNVAPVLFGGASATWGLDRFGHTGFNSLRIKHDSPAIPHVFSSFSQQVKLEQGHRYEAKFFAYVKDGSRFALRVIPSRVSSPEEWERYKIKLDPEARGKWQELRVVFESGAEPFWDLRFTAEAPLLAWIDDVSVTDLGPAVAPR